MRRCVLHCFNFKKIILVFNITLLSAIGLISSCKTTATYTTGSSPKVTGWPVYELAIHVKNT
jgi:hypothetical protein